MIDKNEAIVKLANCLRFAGDRASDMVNETDIFKRNAIAIEIMTAIRDTVKAINE